MDTAIYYYNNNGHLELWDVSSMSHDNIDIRNKESDMYIQEDIKEFVESYGIVFEEMTIGEMGTIEDYC